MFLISHLNSSGSSSLNKLRVERGSLELEWDFSTENFLLEITIQSFFDLVNEIFAFNIGRDAQIADFLGEFDIGGDDEDIFSLEVPRFAGRKVSKKIDQLFVGGGEIRLGSFDAESYFLFEAVGLAGG